MHRCNFAASKRCVALALRCGCDVSAAEWSDSSAVGIAHLAHAADESILCREGWRHGFSESTLGFLVIIITDTRSE